MHRIISEQEIIHELPSIWAQICQIKNESHTYTDSTFKTSCFPNDKLLADVWTIHEMRKDNVKYKMFYLQRGSPGGFDLLSVSG